MAGIFNWASTQKSEDGSFAPPAYDQKPVAPIVGSVQKVRMDNPKHLDKFADSRKRSSWQSDAWDFYDMIGELKFASNLIANVLSRVNLYVGYVSDTARVPEHIRKSEYSQYSDIAESILGLLEEQEGGTSDMLRVAALNMFVAGEFYLVKIPAETVYDSETYKIKSVDEIEFEGMGDNMTIYIKGSASEDRRFWKKLPKNGYISRMWRKHPRYSEDADSSVRGVLDDCDDLILYSKEGRSTSFSRIPAGLLFMPDTIIEASRPNSDADLESDGTDYNELDIIQDLTNALVDPITDESNVHNSAPYILTGPTEAGQHIRYISLERQYDQMYQTNVEKKIDRILTSLDIPKDIARGLSNVKYSNGAVIEESLYKLHIEPLALMIVDILTKGFLYPALIANDVPEDIAKRMIVWYDPSAITAKPSKSEAANFGVEQNLVSASAWRAANGFSETDAPSEQELGQKMLLQKLVLDPVLANTLLKVVFPDLMSQSREESLGAMDPDSVSQLTDALSGAPGAVADPTSLLEPDTPSNQGGE